MKINAFALYKEILKEKNIPCKMTLEKFIEILIEEGTANKKFRCLVTERMASDMDTSSTLSTTKNKRKKNKISNFIKNPIPLHQVPICFKQGH